MLLYPHHPFQNKTVVKRRKSAVVPDIIGPRLSDLLDKEREGILNVFKNGIGLFKPNRNQEHLLDSKRTYSEAFLAFKETEYFQNSQAGRILSNIDQYYSGK